MHIEMVLLMQNAKFAVGKMNLDNLTETEIRKKAELYEKLRRMTPQEFTAIFAKHAFKEGEFDDLVDKWPE